MSRSVYFCKPLQLNRDHAKKTQRPMAEDEVIANQLEALLTPAITAQENYYRQLGLNRRFVSYGATCV